MVDNESINPNVNKYLEKIESRLNRKGRLAHEAGAGAPCLKCADKCPGFELHYWRKRCLNCRCSKDDHDIQDDDEDYGSILIGKLFDSPERDETEKSELDVKGNTFKAPTESKNKTSKVTSLVLPSDSASQDYDWVPPNVEPQLAARYMDALPENKRPVAGSEAAKSRKHQLEHQVPLYDLDENQCSVQMPREELQEFKAHLEHVRNKVVGQGIVTEIQLAPKLLVGELRGPGAGNALKKPPTGILKRTSAYGDDNNSFVQSIDENLNNNDSDYWPAPPPPLATDGSTFGNQGGFTREMTEGVASLGLQDSNRNPLQKQLNSSLLSPSKNTLPKPYSTPSWKQNTYPDAEENDTKNNSEIPEPPSTFGGILKKFQHVSAPSPKHAQRIGTSVPSSNYGERMGSNLPSANQAQSIGSNLPSASQGHGMGSNLPSANQGHMGSNLPSPHQGHMGSNLPSPHQGQSMVSNLPSPHQGQSMGSNLPSANQGQSMGSNLPSANQGHTLGSTLPSAFQKMPSAAYEAEQMPVTPYKERLAGGLPLSQSSTGVSVQFPHEAQLISSTPHHHQEEELPHHQEEALQHHCEQCKLVMVPGEVTVICERAGPKKFWHPGCFVCSECDELLADMIYFWRDGKVYCGRHYCTAASVPRCKACDELIFSDSWTRAEDNDWHLAHFCCFLCDKELAGFPYIAGEGHQPYCMDCHMAVHAKACMRCDNKISPSARQCQLKGFHFHADDNCFSCYHCLKPLLGSKMRMVRHFLFCSQECVNEKASLIQE